MKKTELLQFYTKHKNVIILIFILILAYFFGLIQDKETL